MSHTPSSIGVRMVGQKETCPKGFGLKLANLGLKSQAEPS